MLIFDNDFDRRILYARFFIRQLMLSCDACARFLERAICSLSLVYRTDAALVIDAGWLSDGSTAADEQYSRINICRLPTRHAAHI